MPAVEEEEEFEGGGGAFGGAAAIVVEVIGPLLQAFALALIPALANRKWEQDKKNLEAAILQRLNQPDVLRQMADVMIDEFAASLYGNVTVEITTEDNLATTGQTESGFPIMTSTSYYESSRLIDVTVSDKEVKSVTEKRGSRNLPGQAITVHTVTETYSFALPELEGKFIRARLKERIAELDREMARMPSVGDTFSMRLARDQLVMRLRLYPAD
jgi:hypothetical protein